MFIMSSPDIETSPLPEIELPGLNPYDIVRRTGSLPDTGLLLGATAVWHGPAMFRIYNYDNLEQAILGDNDITQRLAVAFRYREDSTASSLTVGYEPPYYFDRETEPYLRIDEYSYMPVGFGRVAIDSLPNGGRLLISQDTSLHNLGTQLSQTGWLNPMLQRQTRRIMRWFPRDETDSLRTALVTVAELVIGIENDTTTHLADRVQKQFKGE